jgi:hypothetical protein
LEFVEGSAIGKSVLSLAQFEDPDPATITGGIGIADVIPGLTSLIASIPVGGKVVVAHLPNIIQATVNLRVSGGVAFGVKTDKVAITEGQLTLEPQITVAGGLVGDIGVSLNATMGGQITVPIGSDKPVQCDLQYAFYVQATLAGYVGYYPSPPSFSPLTKCGDDKNATRGALPSWLAPAVVGETPVEVADTAAPAPVTLTLAIPTRDGWVPPAYDVTASGDGTTIVRNATAYVAHPAIAVQDGVEVVAFTAEDPKQPRPKAFQIMLRTKRDGAWSEPIAVSDGLHGDSGPSVAFDGAGNIVVAYEEMPASVGTAFSAVVAQSMEIVVATIDTKTMAVARRTITQDQRADWDPQLARATDGTVWLAWRTAEPGPTGAFEFAAMVWNGKSWTAPQLTKTEDGLTDWRLGAGDGQHAAIAEAGSGSVVLRALAGGQWSGGQALVSGAKAGGGLAVGYDGGAPVVLWNDGKAVVESKGGAAPEAILEGPWLPVSLVATTPQAELLLRQGSALAMLPMGDQQPVRLGLVRAQPDEMSAAWNGTAWDVASLRRSPGTLANADIEDIEVRAFN